LFGSFLGFLGLDLLLLFWSLSLFFQFFQSIHGDFSSSGDAGGEFKGSSSEGDFTSFTLPNSARNSLDGSLSSSLKLYLSAWWADISGVLLEFEFFSDLSNSRTVSCSVFSDDTNLLSSFGHCG